MASYNIYTVIPLGAKQNMLCIEEMGSDTPYFRTVGFDDINAGINGLAALILEEQKGPTDPKRGRHGDTIYSIDFVSFGFSPSDSHASSGRYYSVGSDNLEKFCGRLVALASENESRKKEALGK